MVLAIAGKAPWGTPYQKILMVFDGFGGLGCFLVVFVVLVVLAVAGKAPWGSLSHHILMVFVGFGGFGCFLVVLVVLAVADRAPWCTTYHQTISF